MIGRPPCGYRIHAGETKPIEIEFVDEDVYDPDRITLCDVVVQTLGSSVLCDRSSPATNGFVGRLDPKPMCAAMWRARLCGIRLETHFS